MNSYDESGTGREEATQSASEDVPGILIADGGVGHAAEARRPRISAFIWGEREEVAPTLPFGRWRKAS